MKSDGSLVYILSVLLSVLGLMMFLAGCATRTKDYSGTSNVVSNVESLEALMKAKGCDTDLKKICKEFFDRPEFLISMGKTGMTTFDRTRLEQNSTRHAHIRLPLRYPDGALAMTLDCFINTQRSVVISAQFLPDPPPTERAVEYSKELGFCRGPGADYKGAITRQENRLRDGLP